MWIPRYLRRVTVGKRMRLLSRIPNCKYPTWHSTKAIRTRHLFAWLFPTFWYNFWYMNPRKAERNVGKKVLAKSHYWMVNIDRLCRQLESPNNYKLHKHAGAFIFKDTKIFKVKHLFVVSLFGRKLYGDMIYSLFTQFSTFSIIIDSLFTAGRNRSSLYHYSLSLSGDNAAWKNVHAMPPVYKTN